MQRRADPVNDRSTVDDASAGTGIISAERNSRFRLVRARGLPRPSVFFDIARLWNRTADVDNSH